MISLQQVQQQERQRQERLAQAKERQSQATGKYNPTVSPRTVFYVMMDNYKDRECPTLETAIYFARLLSRLNANKNKVITVLELKGAALNDMYKQAKSYKPIPY